jgi:hypothetical protein
MKGHEGGGDVSPDGRETMTALERPVDRSDP